MQHVATLEAHAKVGARHCEIAIDSWPTPEENEGRRGKIERDAGSRQKCAFDVGRVIKGADELALRERSETSDCDADAPNSLV